MVPKPENDPQWDDHRRRYEVWYATTNDRSSGIGLWIRYTLPGPAVWGFAFGPDGPLFAAKSTVDTFDIRDGRLEGSVRDERGRQMSWDIAFDPAPRASFPLPAVLERAAPSFYVCPNLDVRASGIVRIDGVSLELRDEPLGQSHVWGRRHAGAWSWMHVHARDGLVVEAIQARPPWRGVPALPFVLAVVDGREHRFTAIGRGRARGRTSFPVWQLACAVRDLRLSLVVHAPAERFVQVTYHDPDATLAYCANTCVADATVEVSRRRAGTWKVDEVIDVRGRAHVEFGGRRPRPEVPVVF